MRTALLTKVVPAVVGLVAAATLAHWLMAPQDNRVVVRVPGLDGYNAEAALGAPVDIKGEFKAGDGKPGTFPGSWPQFNGPARDGIATDKTPLLRSFPGGKPKVLWSVELGEGYAGPAVHNGRVYMLDYDEHHKMDVLRCWSLDDGKQIWQRGYHIKIKRYHGMSRTVAAVTDKYVVTFGPKCHVMCVDAQTGDYLWGMDLVRQYHSLVPPWYAGQCPLIENDRVILAPGGDAMMIAVECATGKVVWTTPNPRKWEQTHASLVRMEFGGKSFYIYHGSAGVAGVDVNTGQILWETDAADRRGPDGQPVADSTFWQVTTATVPTPIICPPDRLFMTGGYGAGAIMYQLTMQGDRIVPRTLFRLPASVFGSDQRTAIFYQGHVYGVAPSEQMVCLDLDGKKKWASGASAKFGIGPYMVADGMLLIVDDSGDLTLAEASSAGWKPIAKVALFENGQEAWGPLALAGGRLLVRDLTRMICVDLRKDQH